MTDETKARLRFMLFESDAALDSIMLWLSASAWTPVIVMIWTTAAVGLGMWIGW